MYNIEKIEKIVDDVILEHSNRMLTFADFTKLIENNVVTAARNISKLPCKEIVNILENVNLKDLKRKSWDRTKITEVYDLIDEKNYKGLLVKLNDSDYVERIDITNILKDENMIEDLVEHNIEDFAELQSEKILKNGFKYGDIFLDPSITIKEVGEDILDYWTDDVKIMVGLKMLSDSEEDINFLESLDLSEKKIAELGSFLNEGRVVNVFSENNITKRKFKNKYMNGITEVFGKQTIDKIAEAKGFKNLR